MTPPTVSVAHQRGSAAAFHEQPVPPDAGLSLWWFEVERPAVVLGSTQPDDVVDRDRAAERGIEVARRRSGGGAVYLAPGGATWVDVVLPVTDPRWDDDVTRSFRWLGEAWAGVIAGSAQLEPVVHEGGLVRTDWSDLVCFAGLGPGDVTVGGRKVVGISQRRNRTHARFQCAVLHRWDPSPLLEVLCLTPDERERAGADLAAVAVGVVVPATELIDRLRARLVAPPA